MRVVFTVLGRDCDGIKSEKEDEPTLDEVYATKLLCPSVRCRAWFERKQLRGLKQVAAVRVEVNGQ